MCGSQFYPKQNCWVHNMSEVIVGEFYVARINNNYLGINYIHSSKPQDSEKFLERKVF